MTHSLTVVAKVFSNTLKPFFLQTFELQKKKKKKGKSMYLLYLKVEFYHIS